MTVLAAPPSSVNHHLPPIVTSRLEGIETARGRIGQIEIENTFHHIFSILGNTGIDLMPHQRPPISGQGSPDRGQQ